jgi:thioredoxin-related protein
MQKVIPLVTLFLFLVIPGSTRIKGKSAKIEWLTPEEAERRLRNDPRPVLIDLYTDWCGWCKVMDRKTYSRQGLIDYVNARFHCVRLNAESREEVKWGARVFGYNAQARVNQFALAITDGELAFPTTVIIPADGSKPQSIAGFLDIKDMEILLRYFGEGMYGKVDFEEFRKKIKLSW